MQKIVLPFLLLLVYLAHSQEIAPASPFVNFLPASELDTLSRILPIANPNDFRVSISEIRFYDTYQKRGFSADVDSFILEPGQSKDVEIFFHPGQNVSHNSEMVLITEDGIGAFPIDLEGQGTFSNQYYASTQSLSEQALKDALKTQLASGFVSFSYNEARNYMFEEFDNKRTNGQGASVNTLECVYTGTVITGWSNRSSAQNMGFNTEHTFPQSLFNQDLPMRSDMFHLFPTTATSNSVRANYPFGVVSNAGWQQGGSSQGNNLFEPRDVHKGRVARAMFYFVIRYQNYSNYLNNQESILRQWHLDYLPTEVDSTRNEAIFSFQKNRNPFVDYPQFVYRISNISGNSVATRKSLDLFYEKIDFRDTPVDTAATFSYVLVNDGDLPVSISNINLQGSVFQLDFQNDTLVEPGDALVMRASMSGPIKGFYEGSLSFSTDAAGLSSVTVPLAGTLTGTTDLEGEAGPFFVYPQPASEKIFVEAPGGWKGVPVLSLTDLAGRSIRVKARQISSELLEVDVSGIATGVYILSTGGKQYRKIEVR